MFEVVAHVFRKGQVILPAKNLASNAPAVAKKRLWLTRDAVTARELQ